MQLGATSDLHGFLPEVSKPCDVFVIAGDIEPDRFTFEGNWDSQKRLLWLVRNFIPWLKTIPAKQILAIAGNHDRLASQVPELYRQITEHVPHFRYLECEDHVFENVKFWGSPYSVKFGNWSFMEEDWLLKARWENIPTDVEVLIIHGPAYQINDQAGAKYTGKPENVGSKTLLSHLENRHFPKLKLLITGHVHEADRMTEVKQQFGSGFVRCANVAQMDIMYEPANPPTYLEI